MLTGYPRAVLPRQKERRRNHHFRAHVNGFRSALQVRKFFSIGQNRVRARRYRIDRDVEIAKLYGQTLRQALQAKFRGAIRRSSSHAAFTPARGNIDNTCAPGFLHERQQFFDAQERTAQIDTDRSIPIFDGELAEGNGIAVLIAKVIHS